MQQSKPFPRVLTIAGSDSGGGAGIQADLKTFGALGAYGASVITAVTAQNTQGVQGVHVVPAAMIAAQCDSVLSDIRIDAVKIGMLPDVESIKAVAHALREYPVPFVVFDPVLVATSGDSLALENTLDALCGLLLPLADVVTPNLNELAQLTGNVWRKTKPKCSRKGGSCWPKALKRRCSKAAIGRAAKRRATGWCKKRPTRNALSTPACPPPTPTAPAARWLRPLPHSIRTDAT